MSNSGRKMSTPGWCTLALLGGVLILGLGALASATPQDASKATLTQVVEKAAASTLIDEATTVAGQIKAANSKQNSSLATSTGVQAGSSATLRLTQPDATYAARLKEAQQRRSNSPSTLSGTSSSPHATRTAQGTGVECNDNQVQDPGFEAGAGSGFWVEASTNFGTPLCTIAGCGTGTGTGPRTGDWWAWYGGISAFEEGSVSQDVIIPEGYGLTFWLEQIVCDSPADFLEVLIDGNQVFISDGASALCGVLGYALQSVDITGFDDGGVHTLEFHSIIFAANGGGSNFFVDDICIGGAPSVCDDGFCEGSENSCTCPGDCEGPGFCGDGICCASEGEVCDGCISDCGECQPLCDVCFTNCDDIVGPGDPCVDVGADDWISNVTFAGIDNTTGTEGCPCSYGDYLALEAAVVDGETYDLTVTICSDGQWTQFGRAWFDWNGNGVMECDESVFLGSGIDATLTAPVAVPAGTAPGCYEMRITEQFFADPGCEGACTGATFGETEDYTVCVFAACNGNLICEDGENSCTCESDCGVCAGTCRQGSCCGDGNVDVNEECDFGSGCGTCPWDADGNDFVGAFDLAILLGFWGPIAPGSDPELFCLDASEPRDDALGPFDLASLLGNWGECPVGFGGGNQCVEGDCTETCECVGRGACCGVKGPGTCDADLTADECAQAGGNYQGDDTICDDCPHPACVNAEGDCCTAHPTPGCDDPDCCATVCNSGPDGAFCCDEEWDTVCAGLAEALCGCPIPFDNCEEPGVIMDGATNYDTNGAITDGLPHAACEFAPGQTHNDIWFQYSATCTGVLHVSTCSHGGDAFYDTDLVVYDGCFPEVPCPMGDNVLLGCNDDDCTAPSGQDFSSDLPDSSGVWSMDVVQNNCYTIRVGGWQDGDQGAGVLGVECVQ